MNGGVTIANLKGLFRDLLNDTPHIFADRSVFSPGYSPEALPHRDGQVTTLASILVKALRGDAPSNVLMYGKTGTGKTAVARYVGEELEQMGVETDVTCSVLYINCQIVDTQYRLLAQLAKAFNCEVPFTGWPTDHVYNEFKRSIDSAKQVVIIILDEIDNLVIKSDDALYNITRINGELKNAKVSLIGITNDLKFTEFLDPRVKSSLGEEELIFPPYDAHQIQDILYQRARFGFNEGVLAGDVIPMCAAYAAQEHGDARRALDLLRVSAELAERAKLKQVSGHHVRMAQDKIESDRIIEVIRTLPVQSKLVLYSIIVLADLGNNVSTTGDVYSIYKQLCNNIDTDILTQRRITDLISELDMLGIVNAIVVNKGRYGRTKEISLSVPKESIRGVITDEQRLYSLSGFKPANIQASLAVTYQ